MSLLQPPSAFRADHGDIWPWTDVDAPSVRMERLSDLTGEDRARWTILSAQAGRSNIFAQDWFMQAALTHADDGGDVLLAIVIDGRGRWLGVMPLIADGHFGRWPARIWRNWVSTNQFLGMPLVATRSADLFWASLLSFLDRQAGRRLMLHFAGFDAEAPASIALLEQCRQESRAVHIISCVDRPAHRAGEVVDGRSEAKTRSRLRSLSRRLEQDHGAVVFSVLEPGAPCDDWIEAFLEMEAAGWKGRGGSALGSAAATRELFRAVIARGHANGSARLARLSAGGRVVAMSSWFETGTWGHGFKMTFDEAYRAYAPGQLLMREVRDRLGDRPDLSFDTCVPRNASHCDRLWRGNRKIMEGAVAIGPARRRLYFDWLMRARALYASTKTRLGGAERP
jgi:CelD/BcsL family acetyltransferase involved in cellulose biosynthesis